MRFILSLFIKFHLAVRYIYDKFLCYCYKKQMISCGKNVSLKPSTSNIRGIKNCSFGNYVLIQSYATIFSTDAKLIIGNHVALGPKVTIMTGNHVTNEIGKFMWDIHEKRDGDDKDIIIEDEIWVGSNVTILSGAHLGRGMVAAAGSIINKPMPPYSIVGGIPAKVLKFRFTIDQIIEHEAALYPVSERFTREQLDEIFANTKLK